MQALVSSQNAKAWGTTVAGAVGYLGLCSLVGKRLPPRLARKLLHIGTGPLYMLCWPLYSAHPASRWLCASVPALAGLRFAAVGSGVLRDDGLVASSSRSGRRQELLRGPLWYAAAHVAVTLLCWRHSPAGVVALAVLCGGDGLAEVVGAAGLACPAAGPAGPAGSAAGAGPAPQRSNKSSTGGSSSTNTTSRSSRWRWQRHPLPHNPDKSFEGSLACWLGGAATALPLLTHFRRAGMFDAALAAAVESGRAVPLSGTPLLVAVLLCSAVGAAVESLPLTDADNAAVTAAVAVAARAYFGF